MVILVILNKIKHLLLLLVSVFRRALCCLRSRRRSNSFDAVPLTHVISNASTAGVQGGFDGNGELENWNTWDNEQPKTVQDHIELYRKKKIEAKQRLEDEEDDSPENRVDFFENMAPKITRQQKVLIGGNNGGGCEGGNNNRLSVQDIQPVIIETELKEWDEDNKMNDGWDGLDWEAQEALKEKRRLDRERRMWEKREQNRTGRSSLGARVLS